MGLIIDSSVIVTEERKGKTVRQILEQLYATQGETEVGLSVITVAELIHGIFRAQTEIQQKRRAAFIDQLCFDVPVYPVTLKLRE